MKTIELIKDVIENLNYDSLIDLHNQYCEEIRNPDDIIYVFDEDFFNEFFADKPFEAARATQFGNLNWKDNYIWFDGYGNLESFDDPFRVVDTDEIAKYIFDNPEFEHGLYLGEEEDSEGKTEEE